MPIDENILRIIEIILGWAIMFKIMISLLSTQNKLKKAKKIKQWKLLRSIHRQSIALGFSLIGLAELTTIAALYFPKTLGILVFAINLPVYYLIYKTRKELKRCIKC